jgi:hypothetical protein
VSERCDCPWEGFVYHLTRCDKCRAAATQAGWSPPNPSAPLVASPGAPEETRDG